jgi:hypothetical protein
VHEGAASETPFSTSAEAVVNAASRACAAPLMTNAAPGSAWNVAAMLLPGLKSCAQAKRPRKLRIESVSAYDLSMRNPSSPRDAVTLSRRGFPFWKTGTHFSGSPFGFFDTARQNFQFRLALKS